MVGVLDLRGDILLELGMLDLRGEIGWCLDFWEYLNGTTEEDVDDSLSKGLAVGLLSLQKCSGRKPRKRVDSPFMNSILNQGHSKVLAI